MRLGSAALAATLAMLFPGAASAQAPRQEYRDVFTTQAPGASAGRLIEIDFFDPGDPGGKPHAFSHLRIELAEGARFDTSAVAYCTASDPELIVAGAGACPAGSRLGVDEILVDTGFPGPARYVTSDIVFLNDERELILLATIRETGMRVVLRGRVGERTVDIDVPLLPGTPPDGGAPTYERGRYEPRSTSRDGAEINYLTTPPTCPASGEWTNRITYTYRDGVVQTDDSPSPCSGARGRRRDRTRPRLRLRGAPARCTTSDFRARLSASDRGGVASTALWLDGSPLARRRGRRLVVTVPARRLPPGRHRLTASATDRAGNTARRRIVFRRCSEAGTGPRHTSCSSASPARPAVAAQLPPARYRARC